MVRITLIDENLDKIYYYTFITRMKRCDVSRNTIENGFGRMCS